MSRGHRFGDESQLVGPTHFPHTIGLEEKHTPKCMYFVVLRSHLSYPRTVQSEVPQGAVGQGHPLTTSRRVEIIEERGGVARVDWGGVLPCRCGNKVVGCSVNWTSEGVACLPRGRRWPALLVVCGQRFHTRNPLCRPADSV